MQRACGTGLLMVVVLGGCAEEGPVEPAQPPEPEPVPTSITVAPASVTLWWPGATTQLVARVLDQNGEVMAGATMSWSSDDGSVAGVSASGLVTAVAQGSAEVTAEVAGFSLSASAAVAVDSISDRDALVAFYHATGGPNWYFAGYNWLTEKPLSSWGHVTTDDQGRVTGLEFRATRMVGSLPPELGALANLEVLKIVGNRGLGRGSIPPELGSLKNLRVLNLRSNALTGPIPPTLSNLPELVELDLEWNRLTGQIPVGLGDLANLKVLNLSHNLLTGPIPPQLGNLGGLEVLDLQSNDLTGPIPPELGNLGSLEVLDLGLYGGLPGPIPPELGNLGDLVSLSLRGGSITGPIPPQLAQLRKLESLYLDGRFTGTIPAEFGNMTELRKLHVHGGSGTIPAALGRLRNLQDLRLSYSGHTGSIPPELGDLVNLRNLSLHENKLTGPIPPELGNLPKLRGLRLFNNELSGPIPEELGALEDLHTLNVANNELSGPIPPGLGNLRSLWSLNLERNDLSGQIPPELGDLAGLAGMDVSDNNLEGALPPELGQLSSLEGMDVSVNEGLSGPIPLEFVNVPLETLRWYRTSLCAPLDPVFVTWMQSINFNAPTIGSLDSREYRCVRDALVALYEATGGPNWKNSTNWLTDEPVSSWYGVTTDESGSPTALFLYGNGLVGPLPPELGALAELERLDLRANGLTDTIPGALGNLAKLGVLDLADNRFTGRLPVELGDLEELTVLQIAHNEFAGGLPGSLVRLSKLEEFQWNESGLCAPELAWFQDWLASVPNQDGGDTCSSSPVFVSVAAVHLNQAAQSMGGDVPLVAGREALLRVFPIADRANDHRPEARATFYVDGRESYSTPLRLESRYGIPEETDPGRIAWSFDAEVPGEVLVPGVELVVEIDAGGDVAEGSELRVPSEGRMPLNVRDMPVMELTIIPVLQKSNPDSSVFQWTEAIAAQGKSHPAVQLTTNVFPIAGLELTVRDEALVLDYDLQAPIAPGLNVLNALALLRQLEGGTGYYHGAVAKRRPGERGVSGVAFRGGFRGAHQVSLARPDATTFAHEVGHTIGLDHPSCGPAPRDPDYPYHHCLTGVWGYSPLSGSLVPPTRCDIMGPWCASGSGVWVSDYHFNKALGFRLETGSAPPSTASATRSKMLLLWGGVSSGGELRLDPAFALDAPAKLPPSGGGPYRLEGFGPGGSREFSLAFAPDEIDHGGAGFLFMIPFEEEWRGALERIVLSGPNGTATLDRDTRTPMTLVLDPDTRHLRAVLRGEAADTGEDASALDSESDAPARVLVSYGLPWAATGRTFRANR